MKLTPDIAKSVSPQIQTCIYNLYMDLLKRKVIGKNEEHIFILSRDMSSEGIRFSGDILISVKIPTIKKGLNKYTIHSNGKNLNFYAKIMKLKILPINNDFVLAFDNEKIEVRKGEVILK